MTKETRTMQRPAQQAHAPVAPAPAPVVRLAKIDLDVLKKLSMPDLISLARREGLYLSSFRTQERLLDLLLDAKAGGTGRRYVHGRMRCEFCREPLTLKGTSRTGDGSLIIRGVRCRGERHHTYQIVEEAPTID